MARLNPTQAAIQRALVEASQRRRLKARKAPKPVPPPTSGFRVELVSLAKEANDVIRELLLPQLPAFEAAVQLERRQDAVDEDIERVIEGIRFRLGTVFNAQRIGNIARRYARVTEEFGDAQFERQFRAVLGIDLPGKPAVQSQIRMFVRENVSLIQSIPGDMLARVETTVNRGVNQGLRASEIAKQVQRRFKVSENRARLIAKDQVNKLHGQLNQLRQEAVGVREYVWRNSRDARVRGNPTGLYPSAKYNHWTREGKRFRWDKPPADGHPGEPIGCRCRAEPVLSTLLDDLGV